MKSQKMQQLLRVLLIVLLAMAPTRALAVELTGQIIGTVEDTEGLGVPGVVINLSSEKLQGGKNVESDIDGRFRFLGLPPGEYNLDAQKAGFATAKAATRVSAGQTTRVDLQLRLVQAGEEIIVLETKPVVDTTSTRQGTTVTKDMLRDIPNPGRSYQSATSLAPGVTDNGTGNPNMRGAVSYGNQYYVDGVNTTDPLTNTFSMNMNLDAIEEVQVITGGMDAEYGRAMGGAVNIVTRSGGNDFEGDFQLLYNADWLQIYTPLPDEIEALDINEDGVLDDSEIADNNEIMVAVNAGGPIMKDQLWFFAGAQVNAITSQPALAGDVYTNRPEGQEVQSEEWRSAYLFGKLTYKPAQNHRLWLHGQADPTNIDNASRAILTTLPSAEDWWQQGGWILSAGHNWTPDDRTVVETQLSSSNSFIRLRPMAWQDCTSYDDAGWCEQAYDLQGEDGAWVGNSATDSTLR